MQSVSGQWPLPQKVQDSEDEAGHRRRESIRTYSESAPLKVVGVDIGVKARSADGDHGDEAAGRPCRRCYTDNQSTQHR